MQRCRVVVTNQRDLPPTKQTTAYLSPKKQYPAYQQPITRNLPTNERVSHAISGSTLLALHNSATNPQFTGHEAAMSRVAVLVLLGLLGANAQKLTGNSTGSGTSCIPDIYNIGLGQGCDASEGCCPQTNTCVRKGSCEEYITICPPPTCGKDKSFSDTECPKEVTKIFKNPKNLKCRQSSDSMCYSNGTHLVVACRNAAGAVAARIMVSLLSTLGALAIMTI